MSDTSTMEIIDNSIGIWKNYLSSAECRDIIAIFDEKESNGRVAHGGGEPPDAYEFGGLIWRNDSKRIDISCTLARFESMDPYRHSIESALRATSTEYFRHFQPVGRQGEDFPREGWVPEKQPMVYKMQKTYPNGGFCQWHFEQGSCDDTRGRYAVWMLYLNDVTEGGRTDFPAQKLSVAPTEGTIVIWPAAYTHPHRGSPDLKQTKYIVTGWFEHAGGYVLTESGEKRYLDK
jgi:hypothetical protein